LIYIVEHGGLRPPIRTVTFRQHRRCANASSRIRGTPEKVSVPASAQPALTVTLIGTTPTFALGALVILAFFATKPPLSSSFTLLEQMGCGLLPMASAVDLACLVRGCCIAAVYKTPHPGAPAKACSYRRRHVRSGRVLVGLMTWALKQDFFLADLIPSLLRQGVWPRCEEAVMPSAWRGWRSHSMPPSTMLALIPLTLARASMHSCLIRPASLSRCSPSSFFSFSSRAHRRRYM
jgi:hypothetical protein